MKTTFIHIQIAMQPVHDQITIDRPAGNAFYMLKSFDTDDKG